MVGIEVLACARRAADDDFSPAPPAQGTAHAEVAAKAGRLSGRPVVDRDRSEYSLSMF